MSRSPTLPDQPTLELDPEMSDRERLSALRDHFAEIVDVNDTLEERLEAARERRESLREEVRAKFTEAQQQGVTGVPTFAYDGHAARGAVPPEHLERLVEGT